MGVEASRGEMGAHIGIFAVALKVLALDEGLDALLEVGLLHGELELLQQLAHQQLVAQALARLHHPHYRRIDLQPRMQHHSRSAT